MLDVDRLDEAEGRVRRAISVVKKRSGSHENTIREFQLGAGGVRLGPPLTQFPTSSIIRFTRSSSASWIISLHICSSIPRQDR